MYDNITIFYKDAEIQITPFTAGRVIKLLKKRIANGEETAQNYTFLADAYLAKKDNKKAFKYVLKAKKIDPDYYYADVVAIRILSEENKYSKAEYYLNNLLDKAPDDYYLKDICALEVYTSPNYLNNFNKQQRCKKLAKKILHHEDDGSSGYMKACFIAYFYALSDFESAFKCLIQSFKRDICTLFLLESFVAILTVLSLILVKRFQLNLVPSRWAKFFAPFIPKEEYYYEISNPYCMYLPPEKALKYIDKAIKIKPLPVYRIRKGTILYFSGQGYQEAIEILKDVLDEDSSYKECYEIIAQCYFELEDYANALKYVNLAILNNQDEERLYELKSKILKYLNKPDEALNVLLKFYEKYPNDLEIERTLALEYDNRGESNNALSYINKSLLKEKTSDKYCRKASILLDLEKNEDSVKAAEKSIKLEESGIAYYWLAIAYGRLEEYSKSLTAINKSILLDGGDKYSFKIQSEVYGALGRYKDAEKAFKKAKELGLKE